MLTLSQQTPSTAIEDDIEEIRRHLKPRGVFLRISRDFRQFERHLASAPERSVLHEQFDPNGDMDGAKDAFWVCGFDEDGDLVHTQAAHLLDLSGSSIAEHIVGRIQNFFPQSPPLVRSSVQAKPGPKISRISGKVVYHGEMWLRPDLRDNATATLLNRLGMLIAVREWDPDAIFGLMSWLLAWRGFNMRIGYHHSEPMTLSWKRKDDNFQHQVWAVFMEREDVKFLLGLPVIEHADALRRHFG